MADAYFVAARNQPKPRRGNLAQYANRAPRRGLKWTSVAAVVALASGPLFIHGVFAVEDASLQGAAACLHSPVPCWMLGDLAAAESQAPLAGNQGDEGGLAKPSHGASPVGSSASAPISASTSPIASLPAPVVPGMRTTQNSADWNKDHMLNLLLVGMDSSPGRTDTLTDTMILLQVNTDTGQSAMYGIARNMFCMPLPTEIGAHFPNDPATYACPPGTFTSPIEVNGEANALFYDAAFVHRILSARYRASP